MMGPMMLLLLEDWSAEEMGKARSPNSTISVGLGVATLTTTFCPVVAGPSTSKQNCIRPTPLTVDRLVRHFGAGRRRSP
jgi:hypothetical protein